MRLLPKAIDRSMLNEGDHIFCHRMAHIYSHHGIYVGDDRVIHFRRTEDSTSSRSQACKICGFQPKTQRGVVKSCLDCFRKGHRLHRLHRFEYNVSSRVCKKNKAGTCSTTSCDPPDIVVRRATKMLNNGQLGFGEYDLMKNNCEHFARFCKTGVSKSLQSFSWKAKGKLVFRKSFSAVNAVKFLTQVVRKEYKNDILHHDQNMIFKSTTKKGIILKTIIVTIIIISCMFYKQPSAGCVCE
ncbi:hypothetical protein UlMin_025047 [Ulmus minor]